MRTSQNKASRYSAKAKKMAHASSNTDSDDESDAAQFISREAEDGTESEDESTEDADSSSDGSDSDGSSEDDDDDGDDDLPPMQLFSSQPIKSTTRPLSQAPVSFPSSAMPRLGGGASSTKKKNVKNVKNEDESDSDSSQDSGSDAADSTASDDSDDSSSDSDSNSASDSDASHNSGSDEEADESEAAIPSLLQVQVKSEPRADDDSGAEAVDATVKAASEPESSDSSSEDEDEDEDKDGKEQESKTIKADVGVKAAPETEEDADVDSSDDGLDEIPSILPPGTQADVEDAADSADVEVEVPSTAPEAAEALKAPELPAKTAYPRASPYDIDGLPVTPVAPPKRAARTRASVAPSSQDQAIPSSSQPTPQKTKSARKQQRAKVPFVEREPAAETPEPVSAAGAEPLQSPKKRKRGPEEEALEEDAGPETPAQPAAKKATKKSAQMTPGGAPNGATDAGAAAKKTTTPKTPKTPRVRTSTAGGASTAGSLKKGPQGNFTPKEVDEMKRVAQQYMEDNNIRLGDFNVMVQDNATKHLAFWKIMADEFPDHKRLQIILRLRRIYHNFAHTYNWTPEHDGELAELVGKYDNKWQLIGGLMDRSAEDVRKRWDEHVVCGNKMRKSYWRFDEEKRLGRIVGEVLKEIQISRGEDTTTTHEPQEEAINDLPWQLISERMEFTRTARQCRIKWRVIHQSYHFDADGVLVGPPEPENMTQSQLKAEKLKNMVWSTVESPGPALAAKVARTVQSLLAKRSGSEAATPKKQKQVKAEPKSAAKTATKAKGKSFGKSAVIPLLGITPDENGHTVPETDRPINDKARQQVRAMATKDKHALVLSIRDSNVGREDMIPWPRITDATFRKTYSRAARELVWSRLKRSVPNYHRKSVRQICDHLIAAYNADQSVWDAELDPGEAQAEAINGKAPKSSKYVAESDSDAVDDVMHDEDDEDSEGVDASLSKTQTQKPARHPRAARNKVNGYTEQQVPESEEESGGEEEGEEEKEPAQEPEDIEDASEAEADNAGAGAAAKVSSANSRSTREPSVDLSMGDGLAAADSAVASVEETEATEATGAAGSVEAPDHGRRVADDLYPLSQSLSPGLAKHKPTTLARMRNTTNGQPLSASTSKTMSAAKRFGTTDTSSPLAKQRISNGEIRRTKKRSLGSAQWHPDVGSANGSNGNGVYDDIEDVSDDGRRRSQSIRGLGEFNGDGSRPVKRIRQEKPKRTY